MGRLCGLASGILAALPRDADRERMAALAADIIRSRSGLDVVEAELAGRLQRPPSPAPRGGAPACACMAVASRSFDPASPWFTPNGSFRSPAHGSAPQAQGPALCGQDRCGTAGFASFAIVPMVSAGEVVGRIRCMGRQPGLLGDEDLAAVEDAAAALAAEIARREAAESLDQAEAAHLAAMENSLQGRVIVGLHPVRITAVNSFLASRLGTTPEDLTGRTPESLVHFIPEEDRAALLSRFGKRLEGKPVTGSFEVRFIVKGGRTVWFLAMASNILYRGEKVIQGVFVDITDRKNAQGALEESEAKYRNLVEQANDGIAIIQDGCFKFVNRKLAGLGGLAPENLVGRPFKDFIHPDELERVADFYVRRQRGEPVPTIYETKLLVPGGRTVHVEFNASVTSFDGRPANMVVVRDISDRKKAESALKSSEARFRELFENMTAGTMVLLPTGGGRDFSIVDMNRSAESMCDTGRAAVAGRPVSEALPFLRGSGILEALRRVHASDLPESLPAVPVRHGPLGLWWRTRIFRLPSGEIVASSDDVTRETQAELALREKEQELIHAQKMEAIGRLAGGIAHDFNNLLTVINGFAEMLSERIAGQDEATSEVAEITRAGNRAAELTNQLLSFSRRQMLRPTVLDLNAVVADMRKLLRRLIGDDIELVTKLDPALKAVRVDRPRIEQAIMNLAVNSKDAMAGGGKLTMETGNVVFGADSPGKPVGADPGPYVMLSVSDTGVGIGSEIKDFVFEPFFTTKEVGKGTGLGLSMIYGTVKQSGGHITMFSEPGRGSTFMTYLPAIEGRALEPDRRDSGGLPLARGETVLLAEDDPAVRSLTRKILERCGYAVLEAVDGADALSVCRASTGSVDLLLADMVMPGMNGRTLFDSLRALKPGLKVVFMSGYTDDVQWRTGILGANLPFIEKPFSQAALARKIREVLGD